MKARLVFLANEYHLLLCTGKIKKLTSDEAKHFVATYDSELHYAGRTTWDGSGLTMDDYGGETIARVQDNGTLVVENAAHFRKIIGENDINYLSPLEYADKVGRDRSLINQLCRAGRIPGAKKMGSHWMIPENAQYPSDARIGRRIKEVTNTF